MKTASDRLTQGRDMSDDNARQFSDEEAKAILARAIEIDSRAPMTSVDDLRAIATELGVSEASLEAAVREQTTALATRRTIAGQRPAILIAASGMPLGLAAGALLASGTALVGLGLMGLGLVASASLIALQAATATHRSFHLKNAALWSGIAAGSVMALAMATGEVTRMSVLITAGWCIRGWFTSSVLGSSALVAIRRSRPPEDRGHDQDSMGREPGGRRWARVAKRLVRRIAGALRWDFDRLIGARNRLEAA
jgi:hypothetical protein